MPMQELPWVTSHRPALGADGTYCETPSACAPCLPSARPPRPPLPPSCSSYPASPAREEMQISKDSINIWKKMYNLFVQYFTIEFYSLKKIQKKRQRKTNSGHSARS